METKVKICGIETLEAAQAAFDAGADFLGFNFVPISKRFIDSTIAKKIINALPESVMKVGVFMNEGLERINQLVSYLGLNFVQLHGSESPEYSRSLKNVGVIKTFSLGTDFDVEETIQKMKKYYADYFLLDRQVQGEGESLNPDKVRQLTATFPIILAGGLTVENVADMVRLTKPQIVDVAGGVETDGVKDAKKIIQFIKNAKMYE